MFCQNISLNNRLRIWIFEWHGVMDTRVVKPMGAYVVDPTRARLTLKEGDQLSRITITPCMPLKNPRKWTHNIGWLKVHFIYCKVFDRYLKFLSFPWGRILENEEASGWSQFQQVLPISFGVIHTWRCEKDEINKLIKDGTRKKFFYHSYRTWRLNWALPSDMAALGEACTFIFRRIMCNAFIKIIFLFCQERQFLIYVEGKNTCRCAPICRFEGYIVSTEIYHLLR